jgi:hypothetical protein
VFKRLASVVRIAVLVVSAAACSGDDGDEGLNKDQYLIEATTICNETKARIKEAGEELDPDDPAALPKYVQFVSSEVLAEIQELRDLGFPEGDDRLLNQAFAVYEKNFELWQDDPSTAATAADNKELIAAGKVLQDYGLPSCGADL